MAHLFKKQHAITIGGLVLLVGISALLVFLVREQKQPHVSPLIAGPIRYNCEQSGGSFENEKCVCPIEEELGQTQELMYDKSTGYCQTTFGGPGGDAFNASIGLPYGEYDYWVQIVAGACTDSGGSLSGAACICPSGKNYSKTNGKCE